MLDLETYLSTGGHRGVDTSIAAPRDLDLATVRSKVAVAIRSAGEHGLTSHELSLTTGFPYSTAQPRTTELKILGLIRDSGQRRLNVTGKRAIVWVAVDGGAE